MQRVNNTHEATGRATVEALASTLDLPRGQVDEAELARWSERVTAQGWSVDDHSRDHYLLRHADSGFHADVRLLRYTAEDAAHPVLAANGDAGRYAFSTVRLSDPEGTGLLADANLTQAPPDGAVTWLIAHSGAAESAADGTGEHEASASPFHRSPLERLAAAVTRPPVIVVAALAVGIAVLAGVWLRLRAPRIEYEE